MTDSSGNVRTISLSSGTTTTVNFGTLVTTPLTSANVTVGTNTLTFNTPGNPTKPFDPGFAAGDPFIYQGPASIGDSGIGALTIGTTYYVVLTSTPGVIELATTPVGSPINLGSAATTNIAYLASDNVTVNPATNTLTFNTPGDPTTPFDPGYMAGDPFVYEGPTQGNPGIGGLTIGQTYFVVLSATPGVIQLKNSGGTLVNLDAGMSNPQLTNISYTVPFTPEDGRPAIVTSIGSIDDTFMTGAVSLARKAPGHLH